MQLVNVKEAAQLLKISWSTLYGRVKRSDFLQPIRIEGKIFFDRAEVEAYIRTCQNASAAVDEPFWKIGTEAVCHSGIRDHSTQLDHYLYGAPKSKEL